MERPSKPIGISTGSVENYDEFGYFAENAAEFNIPFDAPPVVRRETVVLDDGREMSALVWGSEPAEAVLIHGGAQNAHTWDTVCLALGRPVVAIDMPGHGHSGAPAAGAADVMRNAQDIKAVVQALAPGVQTVVGMSLGGLTTMALSAADPDFFSTMVLVDITPGVNREKADHIHKFVNGPKSFPNFEDLLARTMEFNPTRSESSLRRGILHNAEQLEDGSWVWRHARHRVFASAEKTEEVAEGVRDYEALWKAIENHAGPVVLARGMRDQSVVDDADEEQLLRRRPDAQIVRFEEAGHSIQGDMPVELAKLIGSQIDLAV